MTLNFDDDVVRMEMIADPSQKNTENPYYNKTGLSESDLKLIDPDGTPIMYASMNMNIKKLFETLTKNTMVDAGLSQAIEVLGISKENLSSLFSGNMSIALNDIEIKKVVSDYDTTYSYNEPMPCFTFHAGVGNEVAFDAIMSKVDSFLTKENGVYAYETNDYRHDSIYFMKKGKDFILSNKKSYITDLNGGANWKTLTADCQHDIAAKNPVALFADLKYDAYSKLIESDGGPMAGIFAKAIMSNLKYMRTYANSKDGLMEVQMTEKKQNSLWRILLMVEDAFKMSKVADL
jgi:hypothetical protein